MKLIVATNNQGKLMEIEQIMEGRKVELSTLRDEGINVEFDETGKTFEENALIKARTIFDLTHSAVLADDSGLCVDALDGAPGIYTSRYAGEHATNDENIDKLLMAMKDVPDAERTARFVCAIVYIDDSGHESVYRGECEGIITRKRCGVDGMGYDPVFYYPPLGKTFAECDYDSKNAVSHRNAALEQFIRETNIK